MKAGVVPRNGVFAMKWMRKAGSVALLLVSIGGCKQNYFMTEADFSHYQNLYPVQMETDPRASALPVTEPVGKPTTVLDPERKPRFISLAEAMAIALEQGNIGSQTPGNAGIAFDTLVSFGGTVVEGSDNIRVLSLAPAITANVTELALSKFDAVWQTSMAWNQQDRPIGTTLDTFQSSSQQNINFINQQVTNFNSTILKPLPTGGVAGITFKTDYTLTNLPARFNPAYQPALQFGFEQPLLQGYGVEINQLRNSHPGSVLNPGVLQAVLPADGIRANEGILVTRTRFDQQRAEFERLIANLILNTETAYWNLYGAYWTLYAREQALRQGFEAWKISKARLEAGVITPADLAQTRGQYELFRGQRLAALDDVLEKERQVRNILGMPAEDGTRLIPVDTPTLARFEPNWDLAMEETLSLRPELYLARMEIKIRQMELITARNYLMPDLRFFSTYDVNSIGNNLTGPGLDQLDQNAFRQLASNHYNNWQVGLRLTVPIGFRTANALVRASKLGLARAYEVLHDQELKVSRTLASSYRRIFTAYEQIKVQRAQREAFGEQIRIRFQEFIAGKSAGAGRNRDTIDILLEAQRFWADALANEYQAIVAYNNALTAFEYQKGTVLKHNNVHLAEGALPQVAQVRAVEHQRERTNALLLRERSTTIPHESFNPEQGQVGLPGLPSQPAERPGLAPSPSLPALLENAPSISENPMLEDNALPAPGVPGRNLNPGARPGLPGVGPRNAPSGPDISTSPFTSPNYDNRLHPGEDPRERFTNPRLPNQPGSATAPAMAPNRLPVGTPNEDGSLDNSMGIPSSRPSSQAIRPNLNNMGAPGRQPLPAGNPVNPMPGQSLPAPRSGTSGANTAPNIMGAAKWGTENIGMAEGTMPSPGGRSIAPSVMIESEIQQVGRSVPETGRGSPVARLPQGLVPATDGVERSLAAPYNPPSAQSIRLTSGVDNAAAPSVVPLTIPALPAGK